MTSGNSKYILFAFPIAFNQSRFMTIAQTIAGVGLGKIPQQLWGGSVSGIDYRINAGFQVILSVEASESAAG